MRIKICKINADAGIFVKAATLTDNHTSFTLGEMVDDCVSPFYNKEYVHPSAKPYSE